MNVSFPQLSLQLSSDEECLAFESPHSTGLDSSTARPLQNLEDLCLSLTKKTENLSFSFANQKDVCARFSDISCPLASLWKNADSSIAVHGNYIQLDGLVSAIATQAPLKSSIHSVLELLMEEKIPCLVDLRKESDLQDTKASQFFLFELGQRKNLEKISCTCTAQKIEGDYIQQSFSMEKDGKKHHLEHLSYRGWIDHGAVTKVQLHALVQRLDLLFSSGSKQSSSDGLVHCRAGVGRTGTLLVAYALFKAASFGILQAQEEPLDFLEHLILQGRRERGPLFVQTEAQVELLYSYMYALIKGEDLDAEVKINQEKQDLLKI